MTRQAMQKGLIITVVFLLVICANSGQTFPYQHNLDEIRRIDRDLDIYTRMGFMNENLFRGILPDKKSQELFEHVKLKKFISFKIDVSQQLNHYRHVIVDLSQQISRNTLQQKLLDHFSTISTFSIPAKRLEGMNFYNHVLLKINNQFFSVQGDKLYSIPDSPPQSSSNPLPKTLVSFVRNENFFTAQFVQGESHRNGKKCLSLKVSQIQMKNRQLKPSTEPQFSNLILDNVACSSGPSLNMSQLYSHFFTFSSYQNKRVYYVLANDHQLHFYLYSEKVQQLVIDHNKTLSLNQLMPESGDIRITKMVRMNTHLIITTNKNNILSINLITFLNSKRRDYLHIYESVSRQVQPIVNIKFNDNDYRYFFVISHSHVYQYHLSQHKILKKFVLSHNYCQHSQGQIIKSINTQNGLKCVQQVHVLEKYLLIHYRQIHFHDNSLSQISTVEYSFSLIDRQTGSIYQYKIPFSHLKKCSHNKKILFSKNKNSHYMFTLACFIKENPPNNLTNNYLILEHLSLQTSDELVSQGQLGGIDFSKFRIPMIVFSIGLICYITIKRNSKKSPEKELQEQKMNQKLESEILQTINREKQRQQNLQAVRSKKSTKLS